MTIEDIALTLIPSLSHQHQRHLLEIFGSSEAVFAASRDELIDFAGLRPRQAEELLSKSAIFAAEQELVRCQAANITPIAYSDDSFPKMLRESCDDLPIVLYTIGNISALDRELISMVGTRNSSSYGDRMCQLLIGDMAPARGQIAIVSGLAYGIDSAVHRVAIEKQIPTISVQPTLLPTISPSSQHLLVRKIIENGGAIISERHSQMNINPKDYYTARNRIIAAISQATVIVESPERSGSLITARLADSYGRPLYAIPGRATDPKSAGCNRLIYKRVARSITTTAELFDDLGWEIKEQVAEGSQANELLASLSDDERGLLYCFKQEEPLSTAELMELTGLEVRDVTNLLFSLEMGEMVRLLPGNRYERIVPL